MAGETILIVDDDRDVREILTLYLENEGYQVISALDGGQAVTCALTAKPDLIILDMMLPGLDGIEVCQEIRRQLTTYFNISRLNYRFNRFNRYGQ